jgi:hypothetical protein
LFGNYNAAVPTNGLFGIALISALKWYHLAATYTLATGATSLYVNGKLDASGTITNPPSSKVTESLRLGQLYYGTGGLQFVNGYMDDVRIYDRALNAAEVSDIYNRPNAVLNFIKRRAMGRTAAAPPSVPANAIYGSDTPFPTLTGRFVNPVPTLLGSDTPFPTLTGRFVNPVPTLLGSDTPFPTLIGVA